MRKTAYIEINLHKDVDSDDMEFAEEQNLSSNNCETARNSDDSKELLSFEYHVLYHLNYAVPYLCFNATKSSKFGQSGPVSIEFVHELFYFDCRWFDDDIR